MYVDIHVYTTPSSFTKISGATCRGTSSTRSLVQTSPPCFSTAFTKASTTEPMPPWPGQGQLWNLWNPGLCGVYDVCIVKNTNFYNCLHLCGFLSSLHRCMDFGGCQTFGFCYICTLKIRIMKHRKKENTSFLDSPHIFFTTKKSFAKLRQFARFTFGSLLVPLISSMIPLMLGLRIRQAPWSFPMQFFHGEGHCSTCGSSAIQAGQRKCQSIQPCPQPCASKNASTNDLWSSFLQKKKRPGSYMNPYDLIGDHCLLEPPTLRWSALSGFMSFHVFLRRRPTAFLHLSFLLQLIQHLWDDADELSKLWISMSRNVPFSWSQFKLQLCWVCKLFRLSDLLQQPLATSIEQSWVKLLVGCTQLYTGWSRISSSCHK